MRFHKIIRLRRKIQPPERARRLELLKSFRVTLIQRFYYLCQFAVFLPCLKQRKKRGVCFDQLLTVWSSAKTSSKRFKSFTGLSGRQDKKETNNTDSSLLWKDDLFISISTTKPEILCAGAHSNDWILPNTRPKARLSIRAFDQSSSHPNSLKRKRPLRTCLRLEQEKQQLAIFARQRLFDWPDSLVRIIQCHTRKCNLKVQTIRFDTLFLIFRQPGDKHGRIDPSRTVSRCREQRQCIIIFYPVKS